jgi:hypothetical protein
VPITSAERYQQTTTKRNTGILLFSLLSYSQKSYRTFIQSNILLEYLQHMPTMDNDLSSDESFEERLLYDNIIDHAADDEVEVLLRMFLDGYILDDDQNEAAPPIRGGSTPGRLRNINRSREVFDAHLNADYFGANPTYSLQHFRRRFRMNRSLYLQIESRLETNYRFFTQRPDATGLLGISTRQKVLTAI